MANFLNNVNAKNEFLYMVNSDYFVDKSNLIMKFNDIMDRFGHRFICITRPRRFGKSINAAMLASYYTKNLDTKEVFDTLNISKNPSYLKHLNKHNVIFISFNAGNYKFETYKEYLNFFLNGLINDLKELVPNLDANKPISKIFDDVSNVIEEGFIFIIDEWDYIFNKGLYTQNERRNFLEFLEDLLKDKSYVDLAYMTGILPIAKYSSGSSLNNFKEYDAISDPLFANYFGFLQEEVEKLCQTQDKISMQQLEEWYNGYFTMDGKKIYNPRSVIFALSDGICKSYWTNTGRKNELAYYINTNIAGIKEDIITMMAGQPLKVALSGYDAESKDLEPSRDLMLSALTILGFLSYHNMELTIPNKELLLEFKNTLTSTNINGLSSIVVQSNAMLKATLQQDTETMAKILEVFHASYLSYFDYNRENALACIITLAYLCAKDMYVVSREDVAGLGRADFIFYPLNPRDTAFILELKVDDTPESAIGQILDKKYDVKLAPYTGKKLAIGISYYTNDETKKHHVVIKEL